MVIQLEEGTLGKALGQLAPVVENLSKQYAERQALKQQSQSKELERQQQQYALTNKLLNERTARLNLQGMDPVNRTKLFEYSNLLQSQGMDPYTATEDALKAFLSKQGPFSNVMQQGAQQFGQEPGQPQQSPIASAAAQRTPRDFL